MSVDGFKLAMRVLDVQNELPSGKETVGATIPGHAMARVAKFLNDDESDVAVTVGQTHCSLSFGGTMVYATLLSGEFIAYDNLVSQQSATEIELDRMREQQREQQEERTKKRRQRAAERRKAEAEKPRADVRPITLKDGTKWRPTQEDFDDWARMYIDIDVKHEFDAMRRYCLDKPQKRKTARGIKRFVTNWLDRTSADQKAGTEEKRRGWAQGMEQQGYDIDALERELLAEGSEE